MYNMWGLERMQRVLMSVRFFNLCYKEESFPRDMLVGVIVPMYKGKGSRDEPSNFRPITVYSVL
ncbi:MAG: hypothetical protein Crog4KO_36410 [Crocinitomicaceae bacterium]